MPQRLASSLLLIPCAFAISLIVIVSYLSGALAGPTVLVVWLLDRLPDCDQVNRAVPCVKDGFCFSAALLNPL
jgi:hypothetical protein